MESEPVEIQNVKTFTTFLRKDKYFVIFLELKAFLAKHFSKRLITSLSIYLYHLEESVHFSRTELGLNLTLYLCLTT